MKVAIPVSADMIAMGFPVSSMDVDGDISSACTILSRDALQKKEREVRTEGCTLKGEKCVTVPNGAAINVNGLKEEHAWVEYKMTNEKQQKTTTIMSKVLNEKIISQNVFTAKKPQCQLSNEAAASETRKPRTKIDIGCCGIKQPSDLVIVQTVIDISPMLGGPSLSLLLLSITV